jgi:chromosome segregation ATPase
MSKKITDDIDLLHQQVQLNNKSLNNKPKNKQALSNITLSDFAIIYDKLDQHFTECMELVKDLPYIKREVQDILASFNDSTKQCSNNINVQLEAFKKNLSKLSEECYILSKIPEKLNKSIITIAPEVAEAIQDNNQLKIEEMTTAINGCIQTLNNIKADIESFRISRSKNFLSMVGISLILSIITSTTVLYFVLQWFPPRQKYMVEKAHDIHTEGVVQIFDMQGKFCNKAQIIKD